MDDTRTLDPITELRLRRWARENHRPAGDRDARWHAVVHEEMNARDAELFAAAGESTAGSSRGRRFVPLTPPEHLRLHADHPGVARPKHLDAPVRVRESIPGLFVG